MNIFEMGFLKEFLYAVGETGVMLSIGLVTALFFGGVIGIYLFLWRKDGLRENKFLSLMVGGMINIIRSFPFVILLISVGPLTRVITGTTIGPVAAAVPLSIAAIAYFARIVELALNDVPKGIIEAALSMGADLREIVFKFLIVEAKSSLILGYTTLIVSFISYSAAAGIVGGGGIGDLAIRYGYYRFQTDVMFATIFFLIVLVQLVQYMGGRLASKYNRR